MNVIQKLPKKWETRLGLPYRSIILAGALSYKGLFPRLLIVFIPV
jgi:hypothetical protein